MRLVEHHVVAAHPAVVVRLRHLAKRHADRLGWSERRQDDVAVAVTEAVTNAVVHAYIGQPHPRVIHFALAPSDDELVVVCRDRGRGLVRRSSSPGLGAGMTLMRELSASLEITAPTSGGTCVHLRFRGTPAPDVSARSGSPPEG